MRPAPESPLDRDQDAASRRSFLRRTALGAAALVSHARLQAAGLETRLSPNEPDASSERGATADAGASTHEGETGGRNAPAQSVIHIHLPGGMAQQESFDPKPYAPAEYRGSLKAISTSLDGVQFCQLFPKIAKIADRLVVCRSIGHGEAAHERGSHNMFTGYRPSPALVYPSIGSVVSHLLGPRAGLPPYVCIPQQPNVYAGSGYLSAAHSPFSLGSDPAASGFKVKDLTRPGDVDDGRYARRRDLLALVDARFSGAQQADAIDAVDSFYERAWSLIESPEAQSAFDISKEPAKLQDAYGKNTAGLRMLLARRLVESGVRYVTLNYGSFDHHDNISRDMTRWAPALDRGYSTLIDDLDSRGLLASTLVLLTTEFGRTPKINDNAGRDHWPRVFSVLLAGGGLKRGLAYGTSNAMAAEPEDDPLSVEDLAATIYHQVGIDSSRELIAPGNRPIEIVKDGTPVAAIIA